MPLISISVYVIPPQGMIETLNCSEVSSISPFHNLDFGRSSSGPTQKRPSSMFSTGSKRPSSMFSTGSRDSAESANVELQEVGL